MVCLAWGLGNWDNVNNRVNIKCRGQRGAEATLPWCVVTRLHILPLLTSLTSTALNSQDKQHSRASSDAATPAWGPRRPSTVWAAQFVWEAGDHGNWLTFPFGENILCFMNHLTIVSWNIIQKQFAAVCFPSFSPPRQLLPSTVPLPQFTWCDTVSSLSLIFWINYSINYLITQEQNLSC